MIRSVRPAPKHITLAGALVAMLVAQPLVGHRSVAAGAFFDTVLFGIVVYALLILFEERWQRRAALLFIVIAFVANFVIYVRPPWPHIIPQIAYHVMMVGFLGFAVAVILRGILRKTVIHGDDVVGAFCGYLLLGLVWANLYMLIYLIFPGSYSVNPEVAWRLGEWHQRRALFDYLSFTTMMTLGYGDITPIGPPVYSLTWLEAMVAQFYMAVVVAQLVGLKLAQALKGSDPESK